MLPSYLLSRRSSLRRGVARPSWFRGRLAATICTQPRIADLEWTHWQRPCFSPLPLQALALVMALRVFQHAFGSSGNKVRWGCEQALCTSTPVAVCMYVLPSLDASEVALALSHCLDGGYRPPVLIRNRAFHLFLDQDGTPFFGGTHDVRRH